MNKNIQAITLFVVSSFLTAETLAAKLNQLTASSADQTKSHAAPKRVEDSFFAKPAEGYPVENSLALTGAFIYGHSGSGKSLKMGELEIDVLWLYILAILIIIVAVVGGVVCCCCGGEDKPEEMEEKEEKMEEKMEEEPMMMEEPKMEEMAME